MGYALDYGNIVTAWLRRCAEQIIPMLHGWLHEEQNSRKREGNWQQDICQRLIRFTGGGKMIRGSLVMEGYRWARTQSFHSSKEGEHTSAEGRMEDHDIVSRYAAAAFEMLQAFLLIHDDIMDNADVRRTAWALHMQYAQHLSSCDSPKNTSEYSASPDLTPSDLRYGEAMAICGGDIAAFMAVDLISAAVGRSTCDLQKGMEIVQIFSREIVNVGYAQMDDIAYGYGTKIPAAAEDILSLYRNKTARYTFSLPLMIGAMLGGASREEVEPLERFGEELGIVFQIRDDWIGIHGDQNEKSGGGDICMDKKTIYRQLLAETLGERWQQDGARYFGNLVLTASDVEAVRNLLVQHDIESQVTTIMERHLSEARRLLRSLEQGAVPNIGNGSMPEAHAHVRTHAHTQEGRQVPILSALLEYSAIREA